VSATSPDPELAAAIERFDRCIRERDQAAAERVLAEDYALVLVEPTRAVIPRERWLEVLPDYVVHEYEVQESIVREHGDLALVLHRDRMRATVLGEDRSGIFVISDLWRRTADGWRVQERHSTPSSAGALPGA
jgi:ketosteroid isomerase-like protein